MVNFGRAILSRSRKLRTLCVFAGFFAAGLAGELHAQSREYQIKGAFLINFIQFVTWPTNTLPNDEAPFRIGVLGTDPFGTALEHAAQSVTARHHKILVSHCQKVEECKDCQMVFVSKSEEKNQQQILAALDALPVLTVSEQSGFARHGGVINFYLEENKVRFEINPASAQHDKLRISSQLLTLGKIVDSAGGTKP